MYLLRAGATGATADDDTVQRYYHLHTLLRVNVAEALAIISSLFRPSHSGIFSFPQNEKTSAPPTTTTTTTTPPALTLRAVFDAVTTVVCPNPNNPFKFSKSQLRHFYRFIASYAGGPLAGAGSPSPGTIPGAGSPSPATLPGSSSGGDGGRGIGGDLAKEAFLVG